MNYCPQCRKESQERIPADVTTRYCAFHGAELAIQSGVAEYTDQQRKTWGLDYGKRSAVATGFFVVKAGGEVMILHYSDVTVRKP